MSLSKFWERVEDKGACHSAVHGVAKGQTQLSNRTTRSKEKVRRGWAGV